MPPMYLDNIGKPDSMPLVFNYTKVYVGYDGPNSKWTHKKPMFFF